MYFEESGRADGIPVIYLHGGPGAAMETSMRRLHDPAVYRLVMHDQRGCGKSTPAGELEHNDTALLLEDIERLREHLGIERWIVAGGSWGTTLALAYAQRHPSRCMALVLRGIFLGSEAEMDWFANGVPMVYPEEWQRAVQGRASGSRREQLTALQLEVLQPDTATALQAAIALATYEWMAASVQPDAEAIAAELTPSYTLPYQRVCCHYFLNKFFLAPGELLAGIEKIRHIPCHIVSGRFDTICPPGIAYALKQAWPEAELQIVPLSGHSSTDPLIARALFGVMNRLAEQFSADAPTV